MVIGRGKPGARGSARGQLNLRRKGLVEPPSALVRAAELELPEGARGGLSACGLRVWEGGLGVLSLWERLKWSRVRIPRSGEGTEPAERILKLVLG